MEGRRGDRGPVVHRKR